MPQLDAWAWRYARLTLTACASVTTAPAAPGRTRPATSAEKIRTRPGDALMAPLLRGDANAQRRLHETSSTIAIGSEKHQRKRERSRQRKVSSPGAPGVR